MSSSLSEKNKHGMGPRIKLARKDAGLSQSDIAKEAGVSVQSWGKYEDGGVFPRVNIIHPLVIRGYSLDWILTGNGPMKIADLDPAGWIKPGAQQLDQTELVERVKPEINVHDGVMMTTKVLSSGTGYANALWHNLKSFDAAVEREKEVGEMKELMSEMMKKIDRLEAAVASPEGAAQKRDEAANS